MSTVFVPRVFGGTLILTTGGAGPVPTLIVTAYFRSGVIQAGFHDGEQVAGFHDGEVTAGFRDGVQQATFRDGVITEGGR